MQLIVRKKALAYVALDAVVGTEVTVPEDGVSSGTDFISDGELHRIVKDAEAGRKRNGKAELISGCAAGTVDVRSRNVGVLQPPVQRVSDRDVLLVGDVGDPDDAVDAA